MTKKRVEINYSGRVQGVGFRFIAERFAHDYGVVGYVKNKSDGRVELVAEGEEKVLKEFLTALEQNMDNYIDNYTLNWFEASGQFNRFIIGF
jgi:acylphosphatase